MILQIEYVKFARAKSIEPTLLFVDFFKAIDSYIEEWWSKYN